jgi:serine/threonine-protein kinase haspin
MRCHLYNNSRSLHPLSWHGKQSSKAIQAAGKSWADFKPYNNVVWIKYLLKWLTDAYKVYGGDKNEMVVFKQETRELSKRLDTRTKVENGAFSSAQEVMAYIAEMGWVSEEQVEKYGVDSTMMSQ